MCEALKPCPFCGGEPKWCCDDDGRWTQIRCDSCGARSNEWPDPVRHKEQTIAAWNRRASPPESDALKLAETVVRKELLPGSAHRPGYEDAIYDVLEAIAAIRAAREGAKPEKPEHG